MMVEGSAQALSQPLEQCLLPNDIIEGPVYMFITNKVQPLPANILTQDASSIEAGPVIAFINGTSTPFNQVLMPDLNVDENGQTSNRTYTFRGGKSDIKVVGVHSLYVLLSAEVGITSNGLYRSTKPLINALGVHFM